MDKLKILVLFVFITFFPSSVSAQTADDQTLPWGQEVPTGMEVIPLGGGGGKLIIPKGAKTRQVGAQVIVEGTKEYMSRRFFETDQRLEKIEKALEGLSKEIASLKDSVSTINDELKKQAESKATPAMLINKTNAVETAKQPAEEKPAAESGETASGTSMGTGQNPSENMNTVGYGK